MISVPLIINGSEIILDQTGPLPQYFFDSGIQVDGDGAITIHDPDYAIDLMDPDYQGSTSYQPSLDPDVDLYAVLPPQLFLGVVPEVKGCQGYAYNRTTRLWSPCVVGDVGPSDKIGEGSLALNRALGVPSSPITGGTDPALHSIRWHFLPGVPAVVNDRTYTLQPF